MEAADEEAPELVVVDVFLLGEPAGAGTAVVAIDLVGFCVAGRGAGDETGDDGVSIGWLLGSIEMPEQPLAAASATSFAMDVGVAVPVLKTNSNHCFILCFKSTHFACLRIWGAVSWVVLGIKRAAVPRQ